AASTVERTRAPRAHVLHDPPVQQHVRREATRLAQRTRPRHLKLVAPDESTATRNRLFTLVDDSEDDKLGKRGCDSLEECTRQNRCPQVSHGPGEHLVERVALSGAEPS